MFIDNKYRKIYDLLVEKRKTNPPQGYTERHHIIPKSLGGSNDSDNLVVLTGREHYMAHRLLCKFTEGVANQKMWLALHRMIHGKLSPSVTSREYEYFRLQWKKAASDRHPSKHDSSWGLRISTILKEGWKESEERRKQTGNIFSESHAKRKQEDPDYFTKQKKSAILGGLAAKEKMSIRIEYKGVEYIGWRELFEATGVSKHLYKRYYINGVDPEPRIGKNGPPSNIP